MKTFDLTKELEVAKEAALDAAVKILEVYETDFSVEYKDDKSPLTEADKRSNDLIIERLTKEFPDYATLSEEHEDDKARLNNDWCWVVDPLDGTKEFLKKNGEFTINIALSYKHESVLGVVYIPVTKELYYATKGNGAYLVKDGETKKLRVSENNDKLVLLKSRSHASKALEEFMEKHKGKIKELRSIGSSIKGCVIANGEADAYYRFGPTMEWDTAAMQCVVEEAGGVFRQLDESPMLYNRENSVNDKGFYILNCVNNKLDIS